MENVLSSLPSRVSPEALAAPKQVGLSGGKVSHASDLLKAFTADVFDTTRLTTLKAIAESGITCEEFKAECKQAQKLASETDALAGFIKKEGATGADQYGPVRRVLNQRLSEAKQVFGVLKAEPSVVAEKGYFPAVEAARQYLSNKGVKWDGSKAPTEAQKASKEQREALGAVMDETAQEPGESLAAYMARCTDLVEAKLEEMADKAKEKAMLKLVASLEKAHGPNILADLFTYLVDISDKESLKDMGNYIYETQLLQGV